MHARQPFNAPNVLFVVVVLGADHLLMSVCGLVGARERQLAAGGRAAAEGADGAPGGHRDGATPRHGIDREQVQGRGHAPRPAIPVQKTAKKKKLKKKLKEQKKKGKGKGKEGRTKKEKLPFWLY